MKLTYEELETKLEVTEAKLAETLNLLKIALERISVLEERLNKNSKNSSKPPSTDRKRNSFNDDKGPKKPRPGTHRELLSSDQIDHFHTCTLDSCPCCGSNQIVDQEQPLILQQVELPEVKAVTTQFTAQSIRARHVEKSLLVILGKKFIKIFSILNRDVLIFLRKEAIAVIMNKGSYFF